MPRFPDYVAQNGLDVPPAPQIEANTAIGRSLDEFGHTLEEAGRRFTARQQQQADFDDQVAYQRYTLAQDQALQQARAAMAPRATGFPRSGASPRRWASRPRRSSRPMTASRRRG